jgi:hypothetical protein
MELPPARGGRIVVWCDETIFHDAPARCQTSVDRIGRVTS